ncbi:MAG: glycosyltransferase family 2 protein [Acidobacteria bacterium]|nr:glycosyltransferase family 2 protein [Acidobacteriota bacterium]
MVSVIVPAFNTANYIGDTLESIFAQTDRDYEVIVINDGSPDSDELERIVGAYGNRIRYIRQENRGLAGARNTGIAHAMGEFLAFPDSDDLWLPNFLEEMMKFFRLNPSLDMACADCVFFGDTQLEGKSWQALDPLDPPITLEKILPTHGGAFASFVLLRREIVARVGPFDEQLRLLEDYNYWLRLLHAGGNWAYVPKVLGKRRVHSESLTYNQEVVVPHAIVALERFLRLLDASGREAFLVKQEIMRSRSRLAVDCGRRKLADGDYQGARDCFLDAHRALPSKKLELTLVGLRWAPRSTRWAVGRWDRHLAGKPGNRASRSIPSHVGGGVTQGSRELEDGSWKGGGISAGEQKAGRPVGKNS